MFKGRRLVRASVMHPVGVRSSARVTSQVGVFQELLRLAAQGDRLVQEQKVLAQKKLEIEARLEAIDRHREDLLKRLGLRHGDETVQEGQQHSQLQRGSQGEAQATQEKSGHHVMELRF